MRALQFLAPDSCAVNNLDMPGPADDEVLVASRSVGVCHSDLALLANKYIRPFKFPVTPGHEWSGEVVQVGRSARRFAVGDRVVGECRLSPDDQFGFTRNGALAEFFVAKESWLHRLPDNVSWTDGALVEPFSCGYYAAQRADRVDASDTVVVLGAGPIGLGAIAAAAAMGARVIATEPVPARRDLALLLGAESTVDPSSESYLEEIRELTAGVGASVVLEAAGDLAAMADALEIAAFRARIVFMGMNVGGRSLAELGSFQSRELQARGTIGSPGVWPETLRFLSRSNVDLGPMVTSTYALAQADRAIAAVKSDKSQVKIHITSSATL